MNELPAVKLRKIFVNLDKEREAWKVARTPDSFAEVSALAALETALLFKLPALYAIELAYRPANWEMESHCVSQICGK